MPQEPPRTRIILAALDLLRGSGLAGAGINQVVNESAAPIGSLYHYFPEGKYELVASALVEAERSVGESLTAIFSRPVSIRQKVRALFAVTGDHLKDSKFSKGCPVGAVTLDLDEKSEMLRSVCGRVFDSWSVHIAAGLGEVPEPERRSVAQWILATLEGRLFLQERMAI
jgi:TetR/AcrR family transcriptional repressor of lmrAB and yxaGH operons